MALGVRVSVLERVARCTGADIVTSVDTHFGQPRLGTCSEFSIQCFDVGKRTSKSLMFFENCAKPHLGCTVLLRGADKRELARLKSVMHLMLLARYNWKLELAYLLDERAKPPGPKRSLFDTKENSPDGEEEDDQTIEEELDLVTLRKPNNEVKSQNSKSSIGETKNNSVTEKNMTKSSKSELQSDGQSVSKPTSKIKNVSNHNDDTKTSSSDDNKIVNKRASNNIGDSITSGSNLLVERVSDFSDPLRSAMEDDEVFETRVRKDSVHTMSEQQPFDNRFRLALSHSVLSVSPYLTFPLPYLESEAGRKCNLRKLFPVEMFYSEQFHEETATKEPETPTDDEDCMNNIQLNPPHPLLTHDIGSSLKNRVELEALVADFRATGGRLPYGIPYRQRDKDSKSSNKQHCGNNHKTKSNTQLRNKVMDALHPANHQKLSVSLCIHSKHSSNFPGFCVNPRIINLQFYGRDDIALGNFLNKYCFNSSYLCPSGNCNTPMMQHIRRYIHDTGCLEVSLEPVDKSSKTKEQIVSKNNNGDIFIWSWCKQCKKSTPIVPMSNEAKLISFGKYLELRFHGSAYRSQNDCGHSLHHDHNQYFLSNGIRTCIKYVSINLWEVCLPPFIISVANEPTTERAELINEIKTLSLQGHEVFSGINDRLNLISGESDEKSQSSKSFAIRELAVYKARVEAVQVLIAEKAPWTQVADAIVLVKRAISEACESWNAALQGGERNPTKQFPIDAGHTTDEDFDQESSSILHDSSSLKFSDSEMSTPHNTPQSTRKLLEVEQNEVFAPHNGLTSRSSTRISLPDVVDYLDLEDLERKLFQSIYKPNKHSSACSSIRGSECSTPEMRHHNRMQSDGQSVLDDTTDSSDRKSLMSMFMHLKTSSNNLIVSHIQSPIPISEHYLLPIGTIPIAVRENEPESIIAYALMSPDYAKSLEDSIKMEAYIKSQDSAAESDEINSGKEKTETDKATKNKYQHIEVNFQDSTTNFMCRVYFAQDFERLRELVLPQDNPRISLARSLARTTNWQARGGKSGSKFSKTLDDRYVIKQMSRLEMHIFCEFAPHYFLYMESCISAGTPTLLGKIVGVYRVIYRNAANGGAQHQMSVLVMENLFYKQKISRRFDLKGSERNRLVENDGVLDDEAVLLDQNFMKMCCDEPLYAHWHSHAILNDTVLRDTDFLSQNCVMDYSLLVGLNQDNNTLVVGIIDYIRTFTWDKKLETIVKKTVTLGQQGKLPTVLSPDEYRKRFCQAMDRYFVSVPSRWDSLARRFQDENSNSDK
ncbi:putative 1-phosphatidylinositol 3-phosphate 5-kinase isoform X2 [Ctenocephalides felis]|uniref:putative 1-phosphatidylinositol 3-phosphate 5-kinase isoform X2 n=1 Tax=Ctenocephalides felis TaxID=7515 RepID=UPI000E6E5333|nr:putative 1-phosphatidylinositol 3-phosphate 5-kinase isoform X2 [Ctenocephalides felis]